MSNHPTNPDRGPDHVPDRAEINRRNAQHSTGPVTPGGQKRSLMNGLRHGLYSREVVLPGEDRDAYDDFLARLRTDLQPKGMVEDELVVRASELWWRLGRAAAIEAGLLNPDWSRDPRAQRRLSGGGPLVDTFRVAIDDTDTLDRLGRYEARLERALSRTLNTLTKMQDTRRKYAREMNRKSRTSKNSTIEK